MKFGFWIRSKIKELENKKNLYMASVYILKIIFKLKIKLQTYSDNVPIKQTVLSYFKVYGQTTAKKLRLHLASNHNVVSIIFYRTWIFWINITPTVSIFYGTSYMK